MLIKEWSCNLSTIFSWKRFAPLSTNYSKGGTHVIALGRRSLNQTWSTNLYSTFSIFIITLWKPSIEIWRFLLFFFSLLGIENLRKSLNFFILKYWILSFGESSLLNKRVDSGFDKFWLLKYFLSYWTVVLNLSPAGTSIWRLEFFHKFQKALDSKLLAY
jgi:hypothetical protein